MILEMSSEEVIGLLESPQALKDVVEEALQLLSPTPSLTSRLKPIAGSGLDPDPTPLGGQDSLIEGGRTNDQKKL